MIGHVSHLLQGYIHPFWAIEWYPPNRSTLTVLRRRPQVGRRLRHTTAEAAPEDAAVAAALSAALPVAKDGGETGEQSRGGCACGCCVCGVWDWLWSLIVMIRINNYTMRLPTYLIGDSDIIHYRVDSE